MSDTEKNVEPEAQAEEEPAPMNRAERRAAAHHRKPPSPHPSFGRPFGSTGSFRSGPPAAPAHKKGAVHRKTGE
jgi:hypothetical protein